MFLAAEKKKAICLTMASTAASASLKRRGDAPVTREGDQLTVTPLGAGNEVGRSCVYMNYKGKTVLVYHCVDGF